MPTFTQDQVRRLADQAELLQYGRPPLRIRFFCAGVPRSMQVGATIKVSKADGTVQRFQQRRNEAWAKRIARTGLLHAPAEPVHAAIAFELVAYVPRPKGNTDPYPLGRPDIENLANKITDRWTSTFWTDDSVIVDYIVRKRWAEGGVEPGVSVRIDEVRS